MPIEKAICTMNMHDFARFFTHRRRFLGTLLKIWPRSAKMIASR